MLCKNAASTIIGKSMGLETCQILGQVSHNTLLEEKPPDGYMWSWERLTRKRRHPGQIILGQNSGRNWEEMPSWRRGKSGHMKNLNSIMPEDYEEFISLTLRTRSSKRPLGMLERNWKHQFLPLCFARHARKVRKRRPVARLMISSQNLRVFWKPVNLEDCVWENLIPMPQSEVRKRWSMKQGRRTQKLILPHWWTSVIWRMPNIGDNAPKI